MPANAHTIAGIRDNGLHWRYTIKLSDLCEALGDDNAVVGAYAAIRDDIVHRVRTFLESPRCQLTADERFVLEGAVDDVCLVDDDLDELRFVLNRLYDVFDYQRICAV